MDATIRYWQDLLVLRLIARFGRPGKRAYFFHRAVDQMIGFFEWPGVEPAGRKENSRPVTEPVIAGHDPAPNCRRRGRAAPVPGDWSPKEHYGIS
jgi:catechol 2,3-dioxygenase-like lactoylglutathione lyase family enzyme